MLLHVRNVYGNRLQHSQNATHFHGLTSSCLSVPLIHGGNNLEDELFNSECSNCLPSCRFLLAARWDRFFFFGADGPATAKQSKAIIQNIKER
jgi:hypothetical protein